MSKKEIEEENKMQEGDPKIKAKIKAKQREMSMSRMMQAVPTADVVIRNPTHYAVALKYDNPFNSKDKNDNSDLNSKDKKKQFKAEAPVVVAKGKDYMALKIIAVAEENNIPLVENRPLARGLYENVEIDSEIPAQFYQAVADVLAFIYKAKEKKNKRF
jgi:flagellar biosynthetic protein FlhB